MNSTKKKVWVTPSIEEAPVQMTERFSVFSFTEDGRGFFDFLGEEPAGSEEPGGAS